MEQKIRTICQKRLFLESLTKKFNVLMLGPELRQIFSVIVTMYKAFSGSLESEEQVLMHFIKAEKYSKLVLSEFIETVIAGTDIFESFRLRSPTESAFSYYKKRILGRLTDRIEANLRGSDKPNVLIIVINGDRIVQDMALFKKIVAEFKGKGIYYPHAIITEPESVIDLENIIEEVSIELGISRSCCHFLSTYSTSSWQNSIETDLSTLTLLCEILQ